MAEVQKQARENNFTCEDALCPCCPHKHETYDTLCEHSNTSTILERLINVLTDSEGRFLVARQNLLINHYFGLSPSNRLKMIDVEFMSVLLEILCENLPDNPPYKNILWRLLTLCQKPPYLTKFSDAHGAPHKLADYFSALGNCLIFLEDPNLKIMVINVIYNLLSNEDDSTGKTVAFFHRKAGLDASVMGEKLLNLIKIESEVIYPHILDLTLKIVILSKECARTLLLYDGIHWLLVRLGVSDRKPPKNTQLRETTTIVIWKLLDCVGQKKLTMKIPFHEDNLRMMKVWLRGETVFGKLSARNDITALICRILYVYPNLDIISSGIIEDICMLATATEFGTENSWASTIKFCANRENLEFKKLLTVCIIYHYHLTGVRMIAEEYGFLPSLALSLNPYMPSISPHWPAAFKWELISYVLHALPTVAQYNPKKYIECSVTTRIVFMVEYFSTEKDTPELVKCCLHCIHLLLLRGIGGEHFRQHNLIPVLLGLGYHILTGNLTLRAQINLTYCFFILTILHKDFAPKFAHYELMTSLALEIFNRMLKALDKDSKFDGSMIVAAVDYVWNCVIKREELRKSFIQQGGLYLLLDLANISSLPVQTLIFGALADASMDVNSIPQMVTWRGRSEQETIIALMCHIWRKQERVKGVRRDLHGCINEYDDLLAGELQRKLEPDFENCASIVEIYGCARPKIFAVHSNIFRLHSNVTERVMAAYTLNCKNISFKDQITEELIIYFEFFKKGEIWAALKKAIKHKNIQLLPQGEAVLNMLAYRHLYTAVQVQKKQLNHYWTEVEKEKSEEETLYHKLKSCMLAKALESLHEIRFELFCCDANYAREAREKIERNFQQARESYNLEHESPTYHKAALIGLNLSRDKPTGFLKSRFNSQLPPKEYLTPAADNIEELESDEKVSSISEIDFVYRPSDKPAGFLKSRYNSHLPPKEYLTPAADNMDERDGDEGELSISESDFVYRPSVPF